MRSNSGRASVAVLALGLSLSGASATTYTLGVGFSSNTPTSIWQYGSLDLGEQYPNYVTSFLGNSSVNAWGDTSLAQFSTYGTPSVFQNASNAGVTLVNTVYLPAGQVAFHPGQNGEDSTIGFFAPTTGEYQVSVTFSGLDFVGPTDTQVSVFDGNNIQYFEGVVDGFAGGGGHPQSGPDPIITTGGSAFLDQGEPLFFSVNFDPGGTRPSGPFYYDTTGISVTISIPEPSTWAMITLGFAGLGYAACRRRSAAAALAA